MKRWFWLGLALVVGALWVSGVRAGMIGPSLQEQIGKASPDQKLPVIIALKQQADNEALEKACAGKTKEERWAYVVSELKRQSETSQRDLLSFLASEERAGKASKVNGFWIANAVYCEATPEVIREIASRPEIWFVDCDRIASPNVLNAERPGNEPPRVNALEWPIPKVGADSVWTLLGITGNNVVVGHIDTGCNYNHLDLATHMWTSSAYPHHGWNFELNNDDPLDINGHGTFLAGNVVSDGSAGDTCGMAPRSRIMICRVRTTADSIAENQLWSAMQFCLAPPLDSTNHAHLIMTSLGWLHAWNPRMALWRQNVTNVATAGLAFIASAGSEGPSAMTIRTPGDVPGPWHHPAEQNGGRGGSITIGCTDASDAIASFSSQGPVTWDTVSPYRDYPYPPGLLKPDLCAPGVNVASCSYNNNSGYLSGWSGTSMSTAYVGGVAALMLEKNPALLPWQVDSILQMTVRPLGTPPKNNTYGTGRVSAYQAVLYTRPFGPRHDVAIQSILAPGAKVDSLVPVVPGVRVQNYGTYRELNVPVHFSVDSSGSQIYHQIVTIPSLDSLAAVNVTFPNWTPGRGGITYNMTTWHTFSPDTDRANDTLRSSTQTRVQDIRVISTNIGSRVRARSSVTPWLTLGAADYSVRGFNAICWIDSGATRIYNQTVAVDSVVANGTRTVSFPVWNTGPSGATYDLTFFHDFADPIHSNDTLRVTTQASSQNKALIAFGDLQAISWELHDTLVAHDSSSIFSTIDTINVSSNGGRNLSLSNLVAGGYGVVLTFTNYTYLNPTAMGDTLAAFMDQGGGVVIGVFADFPGYDIGGRYTTQYMPFPKSNNSYTPGTLGTVYQPNHPIMAGISAIAVGNYVTGATSLQHGARIADFNTGRILAAAFDTLGRRTAEVGFFPTTWQYTTWGGHNARLMLNAMCWAAGLCSESGVEILPALSRLPKVFALSPAWPNPFRRTTEIHYQLPMACPVQIRVFNVAGQVVKTLINGREEAGYKHATWDGRSEDGSRVASGVYFYRLEAGSFAATKKMVVIR
jgi:subtilisin family serine protease